MANFNYFGKDLSFFLIYPIWEAASLDEWLFLSQSKRKIPTKRLNRLIQPKNR